MDELPSFRHPEERMFSLFQSANDDQTAILACLLTLGVSFLFVFASFHLGPAGQKLRNRNRQMADEAMDSQESVEAEQSRERAA